MSCISHKPTRAVKKQSISAERGTNTEPHTPAGEIPHRLFPPEAQWALEEVVPSPFGVSSEGRVGRTSFALFIALFPGLEHWTQILNKREMNQ